MNCLYIISFNSLNLHKETKRIKQNYNLKIRIYQRAKYSYIVSYLSVFVNSNKPYIIRVFSTLLAWRDTLRTIRWEEVFPNPSISLREIKQLMIIN